MFLKIVKLIEKELKTFIIVHSVLQISNRNQAYCVNQL